jgi:hypothetical protein
MKLVTQDYGCGTSSSILDYGIKDAVVVSESNYDHVFDVEDDLLFIGHDFLFFLWDNEEKAKKWQARKDKWEHWVWCFERIDAIVPAWQLKSHHSLRIASTFCKRLLACDEDDCDKYGIDWLPQWASCNFYERRFEQPSSEKILFSGQAGKPEYFARNVLLNSIYEDEILRERTSFTNFDRNLTWDSYVENLLKHHTVLNPVGVLKALNTRAFETVYSGRLLLQHTVGQYRRHENLLKDTENVFFFQDFSQLKEKVLSLEKVSLTSGNFSSHSLQARMKSIGVEIK